MRKAPALVLFALVLASISYAMVGSQCPEVKADCINAACLNAGGNVSALGSCIELDGFDTDYYETNTAHCEGIYDFCMENDGLVHNMSCCGPIFIFLPALMLALRAGGS